MLIVRICLPILAMIGLLWCPGCHRGPTQVDKAKEAHIAKLKSYVDPEVLKNVDPNFYTYDGFRDYWRFPLVYPYEIVAVDTLDYAFLEKLEGRKVVDGEHTVVLSNITHLTMDGKWCIVKITPHSLAETQPAGAPAWHVFEFATGEDKTFSSESDALDYAVKRGFQGSKVLETVNEQYNKCF